MRASTNGIRAVKVCLLALVLSVTVLPEGSVLRPSVAEAIAPGFQVNTVISGLDTPTAVAFASDGRVFVAEKSGIIKVYTDLDDPTPTTFADLSTDVYNFFDRGLLGLELHPNFPAQPYVYALYTYDGDIGGTAPKYGTPGVLSDPCPDPPGASPDGCPAAARLSRLTASGDVMTGPEQVLIEDWCQQSPTHSIGTVTFGPDGALYVGAGDAASPLDWGQFGNPVVNPCGDPPGGVGGSMTPPTAEGGALRVQDLRTPADPTTLDGTIIRVDPITGAALPDNPLFGSSDPNARRVIAYGLRNPFRFAFRPGTNEIWTGDVGQATWEEINRIPNPTDAVVENFGWPCYEGSPRMPGWDTRNLTICENLYNEPMATAAKAPYFAYRHSQPVFPGDTCPTGSGVVSAVGFYEGGAYPDSYDGALFFADYNRSCIWAMPRSQNGLPDPNLAHVFVDFAGFPVDIETGPAGDLFYVDIGLGRVRRIQYFSSNQPPTAVIGASPTSGPAPLVVNFDGTGSTDPESGALTYAWDLDGDGAYDDSTAPQPQFTYTSPGNVTVRLRVTDPLGGQDTESILISVGNSPPTAILDQPLSSFTWHVGETVAFAGHATDPEDGTLPASAFSWEVILHHCPSDCHDHPYQSFEDVATGSFAAPDHEYPAHLEVRLTVTDSGGLSDTTSVLIYPETTTVTMGSSPTGLSLDLNGESVATPFTRTVIVGSANALNAPSPQSLSGSSYEFVSWSDGGAQSHNVVVSSPVTYTATYTQATTVGVSIEATRFTPKNVAIALGQTVRWTNISAVNHNVTDTTGMGLFGSGTIAPTGTHQFTFAAAGNYPYRSTLGPSNMTGSVSVPMVVSPTTGGTSTSFGVTWASAPLPAGYVVDVQLRRPGSSTWSNWRLNQTGTNTTFVPDAGTGTYEFRARLENPGVGAAAYSAPFAIVVTNNQPPTAVIGASPTSGPAPLVVNFDGTGSTDPESGALTYAWDLDGDGAYDDSTAPQPQFTYTSPGNVTVRLRVTDPLGGQDTESILISVGNSPPTAVINQPTGALTWHVGENVAFAGQGTDPETGNLPASALSWEVILHHCPSSCHSYPPQTFPGVATGSFAAPDHEYPAHLEVRLTVTDSGGLSDTTSVLIYPETTTVTMGSSPTGLSLDLNGESVATPFTRTVIVGSANALNAPSPQSLSGSSYEFVSWSDGGAQSHNVVVSSPVTYTATYTQATTVGVSIEATRFTPKNVAIALGQTVRWTNISAVNHNVTDTTGMGLFGSGTIAPTGTHQFTFAAAGNYPYRSTLGPSNMTGSVSVPMVVSPTTGGTSTSFGVTWASAPLPAGYVVDVQLRRPGSSTWSNWRLNQTGTNTTFVPDAGTGTYEFRARLENPGVGAAAYSAPFAIVVT